MKLTEFIEQLQKLETQGHGDLEVYYSIGSSSENGPLSTAWVATVDPNEGPYDLDEDEQYICIYAGH